MHSALIKKIKQKKELSGLADSIIEEAILKHFKKKEVTLFYLGSKEEKIVVKTVRAGLRKMTGQFQKKTSKREQLLEQNKLTELLKTHNSTAERLSVYPQIKNLLKELKISSVLDLGCGLNPIALSSPSIKYYAADIREDELNLIKKFFQKNEIQGKVFIYDLRKIEKKDLPNTDLCLLLKVLDLLESKGHKIAERIIKLVPSRYILVSFSTKTLSGKPMNHPQRGWIEHLANRLHYKYKLIETKNENFYLINKSSN